jgi:hypothetical protein
MLFWYLETLTHPEWRPADSLGESFGRRRRHLI